MFKMFNAVKTPLFVSLIGLFLLLYSWAGFAFILFGLADAYGRYKDFRYLSDYDSDMVSTRMGVYYGRSHCGRAMVIAIDPSWRFDYRDFGYRWYHLLPDNFFSVIRNPRFYKNLVMGHVQ